MILKHIDLLKKAIHSQNCPNILIYGHKDIQKLDLLLPLFKEINNTPLIGLPGNPVSSGVCSLIFVNIAIRKMLGDNSYFPLLENGILNGNMSKNDKRLDFVRAKASYNNGVLNVTPFNLQDSSMITNFSRADCLIVRDPFEKSISNGENVKVLKFPNNI